MEGNFAADQLKKIIERVEALDEEKKQIAQDRKEVMSEAKANGFNTKIIQEILKIRRKEDDERAEEEELISLYLQALGME